MAQARQLGLGRLLLFVRPLSDGQKSRVGQILAISRRAPVVGHISER